MVVRLPGDRTGERGENGAQLLIGLFVTVFQL